MVRMEFVVEGSQSDEYVVAFEIIDRTAKAACTCAAGTSGLFCKHRTALLDGDVSRLRSGNTSEVARLGPLLQNSDLGTGYARLQAATETCDKAKRMLDAAKKQLARVAHQ